MFKKVTKFVTKQGDTRNEFVPVESIADHKHFRLFCLLKRKQKASFNSTPRYKQTGFRLHDVLLPGEDGKSIESLLSMEDDEDSSPFTLTKVTAGQVDTALSLPVDPASVEVQAGGSLSQEFSIKPQKKAITIPSLVALPNERQINMDHSFIQKLQTTNFNLYVVYETLEASEETVYKESTSLGLSFMAKIYAKFSAKGTRDNKQAIVIPKGSTLAFKTIKLDITNGQWGLDFFADATSRSELVCIEGAPSPGKLQIVLEEVKERCAIFFELSSGLLVVFLNTITAVMRDRNLFQELHQKVENVLEETHAYEMKTESPDLKDLLRTLENSPSIRLQLAEGITYTLDALAELLEDQLLLLLESLERKILPQQLKLVAKLLQHDLEKGNKPFHVDASLLSFPGQEEQSLTMALVELSGVKLQEDGSAVPMEQPFEDVAALFVALYVLNLLSSSQ